MNLRAWESRGPEPRRSGVNCQVSRLTRVLPQELRQESLAGGKLGFGEPIVVFGAPSKPFDEELLNVPVAYSPGARIQDGFNFPMLLIVDHHAGRLGNLFPWEPGGSVVWLDILHIPGLGDLPAGREIELHCHWLAHV